MGVPPLQQSPPSLRSYGDREAKPPTGDANLPAPLAFQGALRPGSRPPVLPTLALNPGLEFQDPGALWFLSPDPGDLRAVPGPWVQPVCSAPAAWSHGVHGVHGGLGVLPGPVEVSDAAEPLHQRVAPE